MYAIKTLPDFFYPFCACWRAALCAITSCCSSHPPLSFAHCLAVCHNYRHQSLCCGLLCPLILLPCVGAAAQGPNMKCPDEADGEQMVQGAKAFKQNRWAGEVMCGLGGRENVLLLQKG